jgi:putative transport protein
MAAFLGDSPLLVLFAISAIGYLVGKIKVAGFGLGVAAVLFVGLAVGAVAPSLRLPELVQQLGLVLFVYTVGLASGPGFFASMRRRGLATNGVALFAVLTGAVVVVVVARLLHLSSTTAAGLFAGSLTNTPALASVVETLKGHAQGEDLSALPVVAYSIAYPGGVLGVLAVMLAIGKKAPSPDGNEPAPQRAAEDRITNRTVQIEAASVVGRTLGDVLSSHRLHVIVSRIRHGGRLTLATNEMVLERGDLVSIVGSEADVLAAERDLGTASPERLDLDRHTLDFRRVFVSNPKLVGVALRELHLPEHTGAIVTRVRRGDVDILADGDTTLELGDRVRVVAPPARMKEVATLFGDSYRAVSEVDVITFGLGITLGLLLGAVPLPLPGGERFTLGLAGGPLVVGLLLGRLGRTGPLAWSMPYSANLTLRQLGLVLFLAGVGSRSGNAFVTTLMTADGPKLVLAGALVTATTALMAYALGRKLLRLSPESLLGVLAGVHTQPAALAFAVERSKSDEPNVGYATVYPLVTIAKIVLAQLVLSLFR